ncbi:MAG: hypothetical protein QXF52_02885 [Thermoproteota archaeon]
MKGAGSLKRLKATKTLILLIWSEIIVIELVALYIFGVTSTHIGGDIDEFLDGAPESGEYMIIVFKKEYFFGKIRVTVKPYGNSIVTLTFYSGKVLNITDEYTFVEPLLPGFGRWFDGVPFTSEYNYLTPFFFDQYTGPYYVYKCPKEKLGSFLPYGVASTMYPYHIVTVKGKFKIKTEVLGVVPWNKNW